MNELPCGWTHARLDELANINPKQNFDDGLTAGFVPMSHAPTSFRNKLHFDERNWGEIKKAYTNFIDGDVIFAKVTPCFENGKAALVEGLPNGIGAGSSEFFVLRPSNTEVSAKYILGLIKSRDFMHEGAANMTGAVGLRRVPRHFVESYIVPVPPAVEQNRIAQKLDDLLSQVDNLKARVDAIPTLLKRFRQSVLAAAVSGRLTEEWRTKNIGPVYENESTNWLPTTLSELGELARGKSKHRPRNDKRLFGNKYPFIQTGDVANSAGRIKTAKSFYSDFGLAQSKLFPKRTLCITIAANIADTAILDIDACFPDSVVGFVADEQKCLAQFVKYLIDVNKQNLETFAPATAQKNINLKILNELVFPIPLLTEQTEIVRRVEQLFAFADQLEAKVASAKKRIDHLTQSILAKAFRGELVPQDPNDEPASVLLERIKAQRAAVPKAKRGRKVSG